MVSIYKTWMMWSRTSSRNELRKHTVGGMGRGQDHRIRGPDRVKAPDIDSKHRLQRRLPNNQARDATLGLPAQPIKHLRPHIHLSRGHISLRLIPRVRVRGTATVGERPARAAGRPLRYQAPLQLDMKRRAQLQIFHSDRECQKPGTDVRVMYRPDA